MVFLEAMAAMEWLNDHPRIVEKIREDARQEALEEAAQRLEQLGKRYDRQSSTSMAHACYQGVIEIRTLKDTED